MIDDDKQMVVVGRADLEFEDTSDEVLLQQDRRAYAARVQARIDLRRHELLDAHGVPNELFATLVLLRDPVRCQEVLDLLSRVDIDGIEQALTRIWDEEHGLALRLCAQCQGVLHPNDLRFPATGRFSGSICDSCEQRRLAAPSRPPRGGIRSALVRARRAHLPATLTEKEWARTVEFFGDRCALCGGAWSLVEHAVPIDLGGGTTVGNCLPACVGCNVRKGKRVLDALSTHEFSSERLRNAREWLLRSEHG